MCAALRVTRQGYYAWKSRPPSAHAVRDAELAELISRVREKVRNIYGAPKTFMRLRALGVRTSRKRVARIMRERGWRGVTRACAKRPSGEKRASKRESAADLVGRRFEADGPDMAWFADITYVKTRQGWLYLALVMDIWSRRIVGWSMGPNITAELADEALKMALARRNPPEGCVHHSDHGSQYVSLLLSKTMRDNGIRPSMGSISSPWDNAAMESLMGIVKAECVHAQTYATREEAALDLFEYIEVVYNRARIHSALGYLSPTEFESQHEETDHGIGVDSDSDSDLRTICNQLSAIFNHAIRYYGLSNNPLLRTGKIGSNKSPVEMQFWTRDEYLAFRRKVMDKPLSFLAFEVLYWTGIRKGELLALTPKDFSFEKSAISINKSY